MKLSYLLAAPLLLCSFVGTASAQQFQADADIETPNGESNRYIGNDPEFGDADDSGRDAFDGYGFARNLRALTLRRQSEFFAGQNLYRFFDTFTNNTARTISTTINFYGELGSDSNTFEVLSEDGLVVSCEFRDDSCAGNDPVIAHVFSNKNVGLAALSGDDPDDYNALFRLVLQPGQTASLLNFAFLASEEDGTTLADIDLAIARGRALQANPFASGLTAAQRAQTINFDLAAVAAVPEPATWAMMIGGLGMVGGVMRRRRKALATAANA